MLTRIKAYIQTQSQLYKGTVEVAELIPGAKLSVGLSFRLYSVCIDVLPNLTYDVFFLKDINGPLIKPKTIEFGDVEALEKQISADIKEAYLLDNSEVSNPST